jgi:signal transduction histidine kinase
VREAVESVRMLAQAREIELQAVVRETPAIQGDADRLQQVAWNLLSNAIKFTGPGGQVAVSLEAENGHAIMTVRDTGCGIRREMLPYVFERFRQADTTTTRVHAGLGIGLTIVKHLVEAHGGAVTAESEGEGRGSTFTVRLPVLGTTPVVATEGETGAWAPSVAPVLRGDPR